MKNVLNLIASCVLINNRSTIAYNMIEFKFFIALFSVIEFPYGGVGLRVGTESRNQMFVFFEYIKFILHS